MKIPWLVWKTFIWFAAICGVAFLINLAYHLSKYSFIAWAIVAIPLLILYRKVYTKGSLYLMGLEGENDIKDELKKLPPEYTFIRDIVTSNQGNIDYVVVGPTGIWALEVKNHKGHISFNEPTLLRNNQPLEKNFLSQAYAEAMQLHDMLKVKLGVDLPVHPVIVFANKFANVKLGLHTFKGVFVIQKAWLNKLITETNQYFFTDKTIQNIKGILDTS